MKYIVTKKSEVGKHGPGQYVYPHKNGKQNVKVVTFTGSETKVEQSQKVLTDVSVLLEPAIKRGLLRHATRFEGEYDDISGMDYQTSMNKIARANSMFEQLPAQIRKKFDNSPQAFLDFTQDPKNVDTLQAWGVLKGNDGKTITGAPSGAPTPTDKNGDGITDPVTTT